MVAFCVLLAADSAERYAADVQCLGAGIYYEIRPQSAWWQYVLGLCFSSVIIMTDLIRVI